MSVCSGASEKKPTAPANLYLSTVLLKPLMPSAIQWLFDYLPYARALNIEDVASFCSVDPPPILSTPTAADLLDFIGGAEIAVATSVLKFLESVALNVIWYQLCQCQGTTALPTAPTWPTAPTGAPSINPPGYGNYGTTGPCLSIDGVDKGWDAPGNRVNLIGKRQQAAYTGDTDTGDAYPLPTTLTSAVVAWSIPTYTSGFEAYDFSILWYDSTRALLRTDVLVNKQKGQSGSSTYTPPAGAVGLAIVAIASGWTPGVGQIPIVHVTGTCSGTGGGSALVQPCCPPDPIALAKLDQIYEMVTLLQRQTAPFSKVDGTAHTGLSGEGSISVQGLLGARITLTTIPGRLGVSDGDTDSLYDVGWINWKTSSESRPREWISTSVYMSLPPLAGMYTSISYTFFPGVVATITELVREP